MEGEQNKTLFPKRAKLIKPALRKTKAENDAKHDGAGYLDGFHAVGRAVGGVIHNEIIGRIINAGSRNKREDTGDQIYGYRISADRGDGA